MFRLSQFIREIDNPTPVKPFRNPPGPVVIWNLLRKCNLGCKHCYSSSSNKDFSGELETEELFTVMEDLKSFRVPVLILSGGEPLLHPDIFKISKRGKDMGFYVALSSNGTKITEDNIGDIVAMDYNYVGVSIDGIGATNDKFRVMEGAYDAAVRGVKLCQDAGIKVGLRFTMTQDNAEELPKMLDLMDELEVDKFYLSHLNYAGRGNAAREDDAFFSMTRDAMEVMFERSLKAQRAGIEREYVTGNNDADGVFMLQWIKKHHPEHAEHMEQKLIQWGGNATGVNVSNIDNRGNVHPDTMWSHHTLGNVKDRPFSEIWSDVSNPLMAGLKQRPRLLKGRCGDCKYQAICNGNTRVRAERTTGDAWAEDPGCYLTDAEIGL
ncbi:MAG: heme d1 biosynthesis radical SAM protein NirJ [Rhodospirillales bacterium]|nr:heme d1 biosynthesis radical SAM protein NirJ [Rhodospirillales bacterium]